MKLLKGSEIAGYVKNNQAHLVRSLKAQHVTPKLAIVRDNDSQVIKKYVALKQKYGSDIGVEVEDWFREDLATAVGEANQDKNVHGVIVQLPLKQTELTDEVTTEIAAQKDVDGLGSLARVKKGEAVVFDSATATAINWLLAGYDIDLKNAKIALVGHGKLIGAPLDYMWTNSGYDITVFNRGSNLADLVNYNVIICATGTPHLLKSAMIAPGTVVVDGGTTSENGILVGDVDDEVRERTDLAAITPKIGGVGPLTVAALFEHVLIAAQNELRRNA